MNITLTEPVKKIVATGIIATVCIILFLLKIEFSLDIVLLILFLLALTFGKSKSFVRDWSPMVLYYYFYEFSQRHLSTIQSALNITVNKTLLYDIDKFMFGPNIPVLAVQKFIYDQPTILDYISYLWYTSFFWLPIVAGYYLWIKDRSFFLFFRNTFVILCFIALITFFVFPAAPPWMASEMGILPTVFTRPWSRLNIGYLTLGLFNQVGVNLVAPFPSLHTGWAVLTAYMLSAYALQRKNKWGLLWYIYPLVMCFVITYTADHYVIDMIGGIVYTGISIIAARYLQQKFQPKPVSSLS